MTNILTQVHEGMDVVDSSGGKIGTVDLLKMSDDETTTPEVEQITPKPGITGRPYIGLTGNTTFVDGLLDAFRTDEVPTPLHETLLRRGFMRIDADGIFASDRYVLPEQIASVADEKVNLTVSKQDLIKRQ